MFLLRVAQDLPEQDGFKLPAHFADFFALADVGVAGQILDREIGGVDVALEGGNFHVGSDQRMMSSACNAPACFMA